MPLRFRILPAPVGDNALATLTTSAGPLFMGIGPAEERAFEVVTENEDVRIGRRPGIDIELPFPSVTAEHARLFRGQLPTDWWIEDLGSTNGTWVDGQRLAPRRSVPIRAGQRLRIATVGMVFEGWSAKSLGSESTTTIARRLINDLFGVVGGDVPVLTVDAESLPPTTVRLEQRDQRYLAGRSDECALVLMGERVSREHAAFVRHWDGVVVVDLGSRNGVQVNSRTIANEQRLFDGDQIEIGGVAMRLSDPEDRYLRQIEKLSADIDAPGLTAATAAPALPARAPSRLPRATPLLETLASRAIPEARLPRARPPGRLATVLVAAVVVVAAIGLAALFFVTR
jgi:pSer/pThr/pTyr-binding forkhead associated (FHA) protein